MDWRGRGSGPREHIEAWAMAVNAGVVDSVFFPTAALTHCRTIGGLRQHNVPSYSSGGQTPKMGLKGLKVQALAG